MSPAMMELALPGFGGDGSAKRFMLACLEGQRRLRVVRGGVDMERWARSWARRWFVVHAASEDGARAAVDAYTDACAASVTHGADASAYGITEAGHNPPGGPTHFPRDPRQPAYVRPAPSVSARRRARARGPTPRGKSLL